VDNDEICDDVDTCTEVVDPPQATGDQEFCGIIAPRVEDLQVTGGNIEIFEDPELSVPAQMGDLLISGASYYAVSIGEDPDCSSDYVVINVSIDEGELPVALESPVEFCSGQENKVEDLINKLSGNAIKIYATESGGAALSPSVNLQDGITYYASGTNSEGCESMERLALSVQIEFCGMAEGFSPNGDGINDVFDLSGIQGDYPNYQIEIYNRWGDLVYRGERGELHWDGTSNQSGNLGDGVLPAAVYFYILHYNDGETSADQGKLYLSR
jgi:gliding motility-associated-like protein